ncbi:MAG TPA: TIGR03619 family F420-dependent LLM class oxidoreductase [Acidimicrobiales bacterium]|nr:TIGR03619 family F420-dependent LLM class oxidoreductase [Acidimicrobiales bacterium]
MKFQLGMFGLSARHYSEVARVAEEHGFESIGMPEHLIFPEEMPAQYSYTEDGLPPMSADAPAYDPWPVLGAVAAATQKIKLATSVYILPLRHPVYTARSVVTVDRLSGGRVILGGGVGWLEEEFEVVGLNPHDRGRRTDEIIGILRRLWGEEDVIEHRGEYYKFGPVRFQPKPLAKPSVPIELGGTTSPALRRAGRLADGWIDHPEVRPGKWTKAGLDPDELARITACLKVVEQARRDAGREKTAFEVTSSARDVDGVHMLEELGATRCQAGVSAGPRGHKDDFIAGLKRYADEVIAKV